MKKNSRPLVVKVTAQIALPRRFKDGDRRDIRSITPKLTFSGITRSFHRSPSLLRKSRIAK